MSDEWVVIGGKGKPRKKRLDGAAAQPALSASMTTAAAGAPPPPPPPVPQPRAPEPPLPGWGCGASDAPPAEWRPVGGKRGRGRRAAAAKTPEERVRDLAAAVDECRREVAATQMFSNLAAAMAQAEGAAGAQGWRWGGVRQLVVYGLGCVEDSRVSRYQLALALLLRDALPGLTSPPQLFDPAFSETDAALLRALGLALIEADEQGARPAEEPTLFYLPHCEAVLCDNLLAANWRPDRLPNAAILGNSFATYRERWTAAGAKPSGARPGRLLRLVEAGAVCELPVPDAGFHVASAFNDSSLHVFPADRCGAALGDE